MDDLSLTKDEQWNMWAKQAQAGDKRAYRNLLNDLMPFIKGYVASSLANEDWVEELVQNVLMSVHKALNTYSPDRNFRPWLISIIHFRRADLLRKYYSRQNEIEHQEIDDSIYSFSNVTNDAYAGEYKDIEKALSVLSDKQRDLVILTKIKGYTAKEVAEQKGMSVSAVKVGVHRAIQKLKDEGIDE